MLNKKSLKKYIILVLLLILLGTIVVLYKNNSKYVSIMEGFFSDGLIKNKNIEINGDVLIDPLNKNTQLEISNLHLEKDLILPEDNEICMNNSCYNYNNIKNITNEEVPYFLFKGENKDEIKDMELTNDIPKKLCIGDYCITGEHLKILNDTKASKLWVPNRDSYKVTSYTHPFVYNHEKIDEGYGKGFIGGNIGPDEDSNFIVRRHIGDRDENYNGRVHDDNDDAGISDTFRVALATGNYENEDRYNFSLIPGRETELKCKNI